VKKSWQTKDAALVDAGYVGVKLRDKLTLNAPERVNVAVFDQPVTVQAFAGLYDQRRLQRERLYLSQLLLQRQVITLHKLGVDAGYMSVFVAAKVYNEIYAAPLLVVTFQRVRNVREVF